MPEEQVSDPTDFESTIEQNPEAVAEFMDHFDAVNEPWMCSRWVRARPTTRYHVTSRYRRRARRNRADGVR
jgi:hypothetical protein